MAGQGGGGGGGGKEEELLQHLIKTKNESGIIKSAPQVLKKLKQIIEGIPFKLMQPGASAIMSMGNVTSGIIKRQDLLKCESLIKKVAEYARHAGLPMYNDERDAPLWLAAGLTMEDIDECLGEGETFAMALLGGGYMEDIDSEDLDLYAQGTHPDQTGNV
jgi:hypothetical protein